MLFVSYSFIFSKEKKKIKKNNEIGSRVAISPIHSFIHSFSCFFQPTTHPSLSPFFFFVFSQPTTQGPSNLLKPAQIRQPIALNLRHHIRLPLPQHIHVALKLPPDPQHRLKMLLAHRLLLLLRDQQRRAHAVADLAPVERLPAPRGGGVPLQIVQLGGREVLRPAELVQEEHPDLGAAGLVKDGQAEGDVDAGLEGLVEGADAVGGEEEDAVEVLEGAEEDYSTFSMSVIVLHKGGWQVW